MQPPGHQSMGTRKGKHHMKADKTSPLTASLLPVAMVLTAILACGTTTEAQADVASGDVVSRVNAEKAQDLVSPGILWAIRNGMDLNITDYKKISIPKLYSQATEKYSAQVSLDDRNMLKNYVAGRPFPTVDSNDPQAGVKVMHNFERTSYFTDDLSVHLPDADTGGFYVDAKGQRNYNVERHFTVDWSRRLRMDGRLQHDPKPRFPDDENRDNIFAKFGFYPLIDPFDLKGVGSISYRYRDPDRMDDTWLYIPTIRRVRRMSSAQRSDALFGQDIDLDSFGGWAGHIAVMDWKLLGEKEMLGSMHGENVPPKLCERDGGMTFCENWEKRPKVFVVEGVAHMPDYAYSKRVIYVDQETYMIVYSDMYDRAGELWKTVIMSQRTSTKPNPNADLEYDEERMFVYAFTVLDLQLEHGTRAAIPGFGFPDEAGWYIDIGWDDYNSVDGDWFTIAGLLAEGG